MNINKHLMTQYSYKTSLTINNKNGTKIRNNNYKKA